jgi:hypothetical protein
MRHYGTVNIVGLVNCLRIVLDPPPPTSSERTEEAVNEIATYLCEISDSHGVEYEVIAFWITAHVVLL